MSVRATLRAMGRIAMVPLQRRRNQGGIGSLWFTIGFVLFVPILILLGGAWYRHAETLLIGAGALLFFVGILWSGAWVVFLVSLDAQMEYAGLPLVPGLARHIRLVYGAAVVASCLVAGASFGLAFGWVVLPAIGALVILTGIAVVSRLPLLLFGLAAGFVVFVIRAKPNDGHWVLPLLRTLERNELTIAVVATLACGALLWWVAPSRAPAVARKRMPNLRDGEEVNGVRPEREEIGRDDRPGATRAVLLQGWWRDGRLPPEEGEPMARAVSVLPANVHWPAAWRWQWRRWLAIVSITGGLMSLDGLHDHADKIFGFAAAMSLSLLCSSALASTVALYETRREQELIALLPGLPSGPALSRWLALQMTASHAITLLLGAIALQALGVLMRHSGAALSWFEGPDTLLALPLACVPLAVPLWTRQSSVRPPSGSAQLMLAVLPFALGFAAALACHLGWLRIGNVATLYVLPTALWCLLRWRRMGAELPPFPVGRLAA